MVPATPPPSSQNKIAGIYQYITQINGSPEQVEAAKAKLAALTPTTAAVYQALNLLPEGELKSWLKANSIEFWKKIIQLIKGRKYTSGDYVLGERLNDNIYCNGDIGRQQVSDDMVDLAHRIFNQLFGVRISTSDDLDALDGGIDAYKARKVSEGISDQAINRAVWLKQNYFPSSTYNRVCWDLSYFEKYPLVDRIPDYNLGQWYSGPLIGGAEAVNGVINVDANSVLKQYVGADFNPETGEITIGGVSPELVPLVKYAPVFAAVGALAILLLLKFMSKR